MIHFQRGTQSKMEFDREEPFAGAVGDQPEASHQPARDAQTGDAVTMLLGTLVRTWGELERATMEKLSQLRAAAGDMRLIGGRSRPNLGMLLAELRALVSIRDRHDRNTLVEIAEIETSIQRASQFHQLVIDGFRAAEADVLLCRDARNAERRVKVDDVRSEIRELETITSRLCAI